MWADIETSSDYLNYSEVAELIAELIGDEKLLPLSLGVFGGWGVGKSSTLQLVEAELSKHSEKFLIVRFDAWLHQGFDDARASLMSVIAAELLKAAPPSLKDRAKNLFKRIDKLRTLGLLAEGGAALLGVPTFGLMRKAAASASDALKGEADEEDVATIKSAVTEAAGTASKLLKPAEGREPPQEIVAFRAEFDEVLRGTNRTLVVFIDNLDRCLPANAIHTLEAVRLFLFMHKTAFVVAADEDMIRHAVAQHFGNPGERHVTDYLDKLIQIPVRVPRAGIQEVRVYLFLLLISSAVSDEAALEKVRSFLIDALRQSWKASSGFSVDDVLKQVGQEQSADLRQALEMADRMAPMLAYAARVQGNPRTVKRLLNVVRMRASIAKKRKMPLDEAIIAKLALFERCTDVVATEALHHEINSANAGKPSIFSSLEKADADDELKALPDAWKAHIGFIRDWGKLEPTLSGVDLRPAVYLARETVPLRVLTASLSFQAAEAAEALLETRTIASPTSKKAVDTIPANERTLVMEFIVASMRKNTDWAATRDDFRGALMLAKVSAEAAALLSRFIRTLPKVPPWMNLLIKDEPWFKS